MQYVSRLGADEQAIIELRREADSPLKAPHQAMPYSHAADWLEQGRPKEGRLYQVELAPSEDEYLLWDKPLSEQSEKVKAALRTTILGKTSRPWDMTGASLYKGMAKGSIGWDTKSDKAASEYLHSIGIRGIKYLDGSSRSAGEGNYNYVIFNDDDVSITAKFSKSSDPLADIRARYLAATRRGVENPHTVQSATQSLSESLQGRERKAFDAMLDSGKARVVTAQQAAQVVGEDALYAIDSKRDELSELARMAHDTGNENKVVEIAPVAEWVIREAKEKAGLDLSGYRHTADMFAVRHALNQHGNKDSENSRGQIALTDADIASIPDVIASPDAVIYGAKNSRGLDLVASIKRMKDGSLLVIEEVRVGRRTLALASARKVPAAKDFGSIARTLLSNAQSDGGVAPIVVQHDRKAQPEVKFANDGRALAFHNPADKTTYFIADHLSQDMTADEMKGLVRHEIAVHALQLGKDDKEFHDILKRVELMRKYGNQKVKDAFAKVPEDTKPEHVTEEVLAYLIQNHQDLGIVQRFFAWFRAALRKIAKGMPGLPNMRFQGWAQNLTTDDLAYMAQTAMARSQQERAREFAGDGVMASKADADEQRQFREVEQAYGGREAYDRAKAAGKTKLGYHQWVQVRTPNFKRWFGDWEAVSRQSQWKAKVNRALDDNQWQKREVLADGYDADPSGKLSATFGFKVVKQYLTPDDIRKSDKRHGEGKERDADQLGLTHSDYIKALEMLRDPETFKRTTSNNGKPSAEFGRKFKDGTIVVAEVETAEDGAVSVKSVWKKIPGRIHAGGIAHPNRTPDSTAGVESIVHSDTLLVNPADVSKVVDPETGEPLVVFHSTSAEDDFSKFRRRVGDIGMHFGTIGQAEDRWQYTNKIGGDYKNPRIGSRWGRDGLKSTKDIREFIQSKGYDGVVYKNTGETAGADEYRMAIRMANAAFPASWAGKSSFSPEDQKHPAYIKYREAEDAYARFREDAAEDSYIAFDPAQIKSAIGNSGDFNPNESSILLSRAPQADIPKTNTQLLGDTGRNYTAPQREAFKRIGREVEVVSLKDRLSGVRNGITKMLAQGIFDQFAPINEIDQEAYRLMRLSKGSSGAFEVLLKGGQLKLTDGVYDFDADKRGGVVEKLLTPLNGEHDDFMAWVAGNRAEKLMAEDREHLFTTEDIAAMKSLADGDAPFDYTIKNGMRKGMVTRKRALIYADSLVTFNQFNKNTLDMAEQSGLIDGESRALWESEFYVPFYRVAEESDSGVRGMNIKGGVLRQQAFKKLKGGSQKLNADLLENTLMNWAHLLDAAAKNRAAKAAVEAAYMMDVAHEAEAGDSGATWFMDAGQKKYFVVDDPAVMVALESLQYAGMNNPMMKALGTFKHVLTVGVTASPFFKVRNLIRDSIQAVAIAPMSGNVAANVVKGWSLTKPESEEYLRLLAGGGTIHFGTMLEGSESKRVRALVDKGVPEEHILNSKHAVSKMYHKFKRALTAYNELGNRGEAVNRASLYDQLTKQGMSHQEASFLARDMMDFSMAGSFNTVRFFTQVVPFMNARLQGLYKLGRAAKHDPARFASVVAACAMMSIALMLAYQDDDDWKQREDWDRDNYWWFKLGGVAYRIPKPFEVGAMASLAERSLEYIISDEMTGERFAKRLGALLEDNLAMNPTAQAIKPLLDVYSNKDSFTGNQIETMSMERVEPEYRFNGHTSMAARSISTAGNAATMGNFWSPVQVDHLIRGYFGWLGTFVVGMGDLVARPMTGQPERPTADWLKVFSGNMASDLGRQQSRYISQMYEQAKELEQAHATWRMLKKEGKLEEAALYREAHEDDLRRYHRVETAKKKVAKINAKIRVVERNTQMTGDQKRDLIIALKKRQMVQARGIFIN